MKVFFVNDLVKYVTPSGQVVAGKVMAVLASNHATIEWDKDCLALARYSEGGEINTFHIPDPDPSQSEPETTPFMPGAKAALEKPETDADASTTTT